MIVPIRRPHIALLALTVLIGQWGCAAGRITVPPEPLSEEARANLGTTGVVSARFSPEAQLEGPTSGKGSGSAKGIAALFFGLILGGTAAAGFGAAFGVLLAPVFGMGGAVYGAIAAESAATVGEAEGTLKKIVADLKIQESMQDCVLQMAREQTRYSFILLDDWGPTVPGEGVDYSSLTIEGVNTILEISVERLGLLGEGINPPLPLVMSTRARLVKANDGTELYAGTWVYQSRTRKFVEWAANDAQPFREEVDRASQSLATEIGDVLFQFQRQQPETEVEQSTGAPESEPGWR